MAGAAEGVRVEGLRDFLRAVNAADKQTKKLVRTGLREVAEPVRVEAEARASGSIRNIGPVWSRMKTGVTSRVVYVAPATRRRGGSPRPNLGRLLMTEALEPALEAKRNEVVDKVEQALDNIIDANF